MTEQAQQEPRLTRAWMVCQCCHKVTLAIAGLTQHQLPIEQMDACPHPCVGARVVGLEVALDCLRTFLDTAFEGGRHQRRVDKLA